MVVISGPARSRSADWLEGPASPPEASAPEPLLRGAGVLWCRRERRKGSPDGDDGDPDPEPSGVSRTDASMRLDALRACFDPDKGHDAREPDPGLQTDL